MKRHVLEYLDEIVKKVPDKVAFAGEEGSYTFLETDQTSRRIGTFLCKQGLHRKPVVVFMKKSVEMIVTFFGVLQSGCFYVPVDAEMPEARIHLILENCSPEVVICDVGTETVAGRLGFEGRIFTYQEMTSVPADDALLRKVREQALDVDPVYIVFTSGSTGVPKGVCACHRSVIDYVEQLSDVLGVDENTVFGNQVPLYLDACLKEIYPTLKFGATTYLIPGSLFLFPVRLVEYLNEKRINTICWVVSALTMISSFGTFREILPKYLKTIAFGSEVFPVKQFRLWKEALPEADFFNLYGPTEGTGMCCYYPVKRELREDEQIPIGYPFRNTEIILLDEKNHPAGNGEQGEICIRGTSVTLGYYNAPEKTAQSFVQNPLNTAYPELIYRTGDIGRRNEYGELVFLSRKDDQIKHMGHRIELGEIEANVNQLDEVKMSACTYEKEKGRIHLYYTGEIGEGALMEALKKTLPRYMLPNRMIRLERMPLMPNGKIDRKSLKERDREGKRDAEIIGDTTGITSGGGFSGTGGFD